MLGSYLGKKKTDIKKSQSIVISRELLSTMLLILVLLVSIRKSVDKEFKKNTKEITNNNGVSKESSFSKVILYRDFDISKEESIDLVAGSIKHLIVTHDLSATVISSNKSIKEASEIGENLWTALKEQQAPLQYVRVLTSIGARNSIQLIMSETKVR